MSLQDIIDITNEHYGDGWEVARAYEMRDDSLDRRLTETNDTLSVFIAKELEETFAGGGTDISQLGEAVRVMETARDELSDVVDALIEQSVRLENDEVWRRCNPGVDPDYEAAWADQGGAQ
jgi:hypothetical protein